MTDSPPWPRVAATMAQATKGSPCTSSTSVSFDDATDDFAGRFLNMLAVVGMAHSERRAFCVMPWRRSRRLAFEAMYHFVGGQLYGDTATSASKGMTSASTRHAFAPATRHLAREHYYAASKPALNKYHRDELNVAVHWPPSESRSRTTDGAVGPALRKCFQSLASQHMAASNGQQRPKMAFHVFTEAKKHEQEVSTVADVSPLGAVHLQRDELKVVFHHLVSADVLIVDSASKLSMTAAALSSRRIGRIGRLLNVTRCDGERVAGPASRQAPITWLDRHQGGAACLDGSPYGFYMVPPATRGNTTRWTIQFGGGAWCSDQRSCEERAASQAGNSSLFPRHGPPSGCECMHGGEGVDCHCLYLPYCDGASFAGFRREPLLTARGVPLHFRGLPNLDRTLDHAISHLGLRDATEVVVTGSSAGGLASFLHVDRIAARVGASARTVAAPSAGYFVSTRTAPRRGAALRDSMRTLVALHNLTPAPAGALSTHCLATSLGAPHECMLAPQMPRFVQAPFFVLNSKYDWWQAAFNLKLPCYLGSGPRGAGCTAPEQAALGKFGRSLMHTAEAVVMTAGSRNGAFITSCVCHLCPWRTLVLHNRSGREHYYRWLRGETAGADSIHIDQRPPTASC